MKTNTLSLSIFALLTYFTSTLGMKAVVPPPDGSYPNFNTAERQNALKNLTTGAGNTAVGWYSLFGATDGSFNTGLGAGALLLTTSGIENTAIGTAALLLNTASRNTAVGCRALLNNTGGSGNTAIALEALTFNNTGQLNTALGDNALRNNTTGNINTAIGAGALEINTGAANTAIGMQAMSHNTTGNNNTAIGVMALAANTTGRDNVALGSGAADEVWDADDVIAIGTVGQNVSHSCYIDNIWGAPVDPGNAVVSVDGNGKLGTTLSSRRFKRDIQPMDNTSEAILALKPVTFHYKNDAKNTPCFGLVAEDVEKVNPHLIVRDKNGELLTVRYEQINAMLLNEFLKEHRKVQEQEATIALLKSTDAKQEATISYLKKDVEVLTTQLKEQAAHIQKVSAQVESSKPAGRVASAD